MAFTLSHMVVAPAFHAIFLRKIPLASFAIGAISPDVTGLLIGNRYWAHTYAAVFSIDLIFGVIGCAIWYVLYRPCIYFWLNRQDIQQINSWLDFIFALLIGLMLGGLSHILWDSFTHTNHPSLLPHQLANYMLSVPFTHVQLPFFLFSQYLTSLLTLPLLYFLIRPILLTAKQNEKQSGKNFWLVLGLSGLVGLINCYAQHDQLMQFWQNNWYWFLRQSFITFAIGFIAMFNLLCLLVRLFKYQNFKKSPL